MAAAPQAFFLPTGTGRSLFAIADGPPDGQAPRAAVLLAPPFAEELNKSRRMLALQARALAGDGCLVLRVDLTGCGDSSGEFEDASWDGWLDDLLAGAAWLRARTAAPLVLWGVRAGCLLARALAPRLPVPPAALLAWQPAADGRALLQQFLRLKVVGDALGASDGAAGVGDAAGRGGAQGGAMAQLKAELAAGRPVTVAGYVLPPAVADGLSAATMASPPSAPASPSLPSAWFELSTRPDATPSPALARLAQQWADAGHPVAHRVVAGPAFWLATEIEEAPALIDAGVDAVRAWTAKTATLETPVRAAPAPAAAA